ncbi:MAG: hypothetical protein QXL10_00945 [Candidatus Bathyarchaeia archaeon]
MAKTEDFASGKQNMKNNTDSESAVKAAKLLAKHQPIIGLLLIGVGLGNFAFVALGGWYQIITKLSWSKPTQELLWYYRGSIETAHYFVAFALIAFGLFFLLTAKKEEGSLKKSKIRTSMGKSLSSQRIVSRRTAPAEPALLP